MKPRLWPLSALHLSFTRYVGMLVCSFSSSPLLLEGGCPCHGCTELKIEGWGCLRPQRLTGK